MTRVLALDPVGRLAGAGLDVFGEEPPAACDLGRPDLVMTPHMAFYSVESIEELKTTAAATMSNALLGAAVPNRIA